MVDNVGVVMTIAGHMSIVSIGGHVSIGGLLLVRVLLYFRHWIDLPVIKGLEMSAAGLDIIREMHISLTVSGSDPCWQCVVRVVTCHLTSGNLSLDTRKIFRCLSVLLCKILD